MGQFSMGQAVLREEDPRLLRGEGRYTADLELPRNTLHASVVRSTHAHARILAIHTDSAKACPGGVAVYTSADIAEDKLGSIVCRMPMKRADGRPMHQSGMLGIVRETTRMVDDIVAYVVAETLWQARDAAERVEVEYDPLPPVVLASDAVKPGAPALWEDCPDNIAWVYEAGTVGALGLRQQRSDQCPRAPGRHPPRHPRHPAKNLARNPASQKNIVLTKVSSRQARAMG